MLVVWRPVGKMVLRTSLLRQRRETVAFYSSGTPTIMVVLLFWRSMVGVANLVLSSSLRKKGVRVGVVWQSC